jgi:hypothetical protein
MAELRDEPRLARQAGDRFGIRYVRSEHVLDSDHTRQRPRQGGITHGRAGAARLPTGVVLGGDSTQKRPTRDRPGRGGRRVRMALG